jgi:tetratricopeptide (TPR) repeat protein
MPNDWGKAEILARGLYWLGRKDEAIYWFQQAFYLKDKSFRSAEKLGSHTKGDWSLSMANYLLKAGSENKEAKALLLQAIDYYLENLKRYPDNENTWGSIAECHFLLSQYEQVIEDIQELHKIRPKPYRRFDTLGLLAKAKLENDIEAVTEAIELIEAGIKRERLRPYYEGDTFSLWDRYEAALEIVKELDPLKYQELAKYLY